MQCHTHRQQISLLVHRHNYFLLEEQICETFYDRVNLHPIKEDVVKAIADIWKLLNSRLGYLNTIVECFRIVFDGCIYLKNYAVNMGFKRIFETFFVVNSDVKISKYLLEDIKERVLGSYTKRFWYPKAHTVLCFILYKSFVIFHKEILFILSTLK